MIRFSALAVALLLAACGGEYHDKFPYPRQFVQEGEVSLYTLDSPPPISSNVYKREINTILAMQKKLTAADLAAIKDEDHIRPEMLVQPVLGQQFTEANFPALYTLLKHAGSDAWRAGDMIQEHWKKPRPWVSDKRVKIHVSEIRRPSYPSGHTTTNGVWAHILSDLMPCQEQKLFDRVTEIGYHRVAAGVHYPSDVEGGRKLAKVVYHRMLEDSAFRAERDAAAAELQEKLRYGIPVSDDVELDTGYIARCAPIPISAVMPAAPAPLRTN